MDTNLKMKQLHDEITRSKYESKPMTDIELSIAAIHSGDEDLKTKRIKELIKQLTTMSLKYEREVAE